MENIKYISCFGTISEHDKKSIIEFWSREKLSNTPGFNVEQRLNEIAFIAKAYVSEDLIVGNSYEESSIELSKQEQVIGISTYYVDRDEYLNANFYFLRASVSKNFRKTGVAAQLVDKMTKQLESMTLAENNHSIKGAVIVYENTYLKKYFNGAVVESPTFYFYAFDKQNCPRRVHYFKNAKVLE